MSFVQESEVEQRNPDHLECVESGVSADTSSTPQHSHTVVVAIDFGTTYSGYAYSFTRDPDNVHIMRKWEGG